MTAKQPAGVTRIYRGPLLLVHPAASKCHGDPSFLKGLGTARDEECPDEDTSLAFQVARAAERFGKYVSLRYVVGDDRSEANPDDPFGEGWVRAKGVVDADGYLTRGTRLGSWVVRERFEVSGRDLLAELKKCVGKFCHLEVTYSTPPRRAD